MSTFIPLDALEIASPCKADWSRMRGDERARFCNSCEKHVYNLADMTRAEAESLIRSREGEVCVRMMRRADGTVITGDCPVGVKIGRRSLTWTRSAAALLCLPLVALAMSSINAHATTVKTDSIRLDAETPTPTPPPAPPMMGAVAWNGPSEAVPSENNDADTDADDPKPIPPRFDVQPTLMGRIVCPAPTPKPSPEPAPEE